MSDSSSSLWERTKDLARRAGKEARAVSVHDREVGEDEPPAGASETAGDGLQRDVAADAELDDEPGEDPAGP